jgi:hypothetical protein
VSRDSGAAAGTRSAPPSGSRVKRASPRTRQSEASSCR